jgi:hypothetical protein
VRAAEDGRTGPLPTLEQCIDGMFPKNDSATSAVEHENKGDGMRPPTTKTATVENDFAEAEERSSTVIKTGEPQSRLRTGRVTLEITYIDGCGHPATWPWGDWIDRPRSGESVRVVGDEEREAADRVSREEGYRVLLTELMTTRNERDAAIRERDSLEARVAHLEDANRALKDAADTASGWVDKLNARVAELESANGGGVLTSHAWGVVLELHDAARAFMDSTIFAHEVRLDGAIAAAERLLIKPRPVVPASGGNRPETPEGSTQSANGGVEQPNQPLADGGRPCDSTDGIGNRHRCKCPSTGGNESRGTDDRAAPTASGGGEVEPVAISPAERDGLQVIVDGVIRHGNGFVVIPGSDSLRAVESLLARHTTAPPQPRGWLTEEERWAFQAAADASFRHGSQHAAIVVQAFLASSSPPEVVWPERCPRGGIGETWEFARDGMWIAAISAAGVAVKEVG